MPVKTILVLANSWKYEPGRCVAGREIIREPGRYRIGGWVRPVSPTGHEGELTPDEIRLDTGHGVKPWDVVLVSFAGKGNNPSQPENLVIDGSPWKSAGKQFLRPVSAAIEEHPADLWLQPEMNSDRVTDEWLAANPPKQSLFCIRPERLHLSFSTNQWGKFRKRAIFTYHGTRYDLGLTDPVAIAAHCSRVPPQDQPPFVVDGDTRKTLLCVSLAGAFNGAHYKLVATVLCE